MGMTIWVNTLKDGAVTSDESDKSAMYRHLSRLDGVCVGVGLRKLSDFLDTTDLETAFAGDDVTGEDGWERMAKVGQWFPPQEGVAVLTGLIARLREKPVRFGLLSNQYAEVLEDLGDCLASIEAAQAQQAMFHLGVVA